MHEKGFDGDGLHPGQERFHGRAGSGYHRRFDSMIERQKKGPGEALVSTVLFSDDSSVIYDRVDIRKIEPMTDAQYFVYGCTALIDAIGGAIHHIRNVHKYAREEDRPEHTVFVITTDGMENASRRYSSDEVKAMVLRQKEQCEWEFLFLGANIDAVETAAGFGISEDFATNFCNDARGQELCFAGVSDAMDAVRACEPLGASWKEDIEADYESRN